MKFSSTASRVFLTSVAATLLAACGAKSSNEDQVRVLLASAEEAAEARDVSDVLELVADDYSDRQAFDKNSLRDFLRGYFLLHPKLELLLDVQQVEFPAQGLARVRVGVMTVPTDPLSLGESATLQLELRRYGGEWRVSRADRVLD